MIVVSDLMGTLTAGSPFLGLVDWEKYNQSKWRANFHFAAAIPGYLLAKSGLIDWQRWGQEITVKSLSYIQDATPEKIQSAAEWITEKNLWLKRREDVITRLQSHRAQGAKIYIASSVMEPFVEPFARRIGAEAIGTPTEIINGRFQIVGEMATDAKKVERVLSKLGVERVDFAYGDSILDLPLLERAEHPTAVYPEAKLKAVARERGWEIFEAS